MGTKGRSQKELLEEYNQKQLHLFKFVDKDKTPNKIFKLPRVSSAPGRVASSQVDNYTMHVEMLGTEAHELRFIKKNGHAESFVWQTSAQNLKQAVRWGITSTESMTGKAIAALGEYRLIAHERIIKGFISNSHLSKIALLDFYQSQLESLQGLESLLNSSATQKSIDKALTDYIEALDDLFKELNNCFDNTLLGESGLNIAPKLLEELKAAKARATQLQEEVGKQNENKIKGFTDTSGRKSLRHFIKSEMVTALYTLSGINQDLSFSGKRILFAATRGELNSCIEDAKKVLDDYEPDLRNATLDAHHGRYGKDDQVTIYDFSQDNLTPEKERRTVMAISFIEGCDQLDLRDRKAPKIKNGGSDDGRKLAVKYSTNWSFYRDWKAFFKRLQHGTLRFLKGLFVSTRPWVGDPWHDNNKLFAHKLQELTTPNEPLWRKPFYLLKGLGSFFKDIGFGIIDIGKQLTVNLFWFLKEDWDSTKKLDWKASRVQIEGEIQDIKKDEQEKLKDLFIKINDGGVPLQFSAQLPPSKTNPVGASEYHLTTGDRNDILSSVGRGLNDFADVISHDIFAKNPVPAIAFTLVGLTCASSILLPGLVKSLFGKDMGPVLIKLFNGLGDQVGASPLAKAGSASLSSSNLSSLATDFLLNGPHSNLVGLLDKLSDDPLTAATGLALAYTLGYVLINGVGPLKYPPIQDFLVEELGDSKKIGYTTIGAKLSLLAYEAFHTPSHAGIASLSEEEFQKIQQKVERFREEPSFKAVIEKYDMISWLLKNKSHFPQLPSLMRSQIIRRIGEVFDYQAARSLSLLVKPEKKHSIAFQLLVIPLSYIPAIFRVVLSVPLSLTALIAGRENPAVPLKHSIKTLYHKSLRDLSRLLVFGKLLVQFIYKVISTPLKLLFTLGSLLIGRIGGLFGLNPSFHMHNAMGKVHNVIDAIAEFFMPVKGLKKELVAHPNHTIRESYQTFMRKFGTPQARSDAESEQEENVHNAGFDPNPAFEGAVPTPTHSMGRGRSWSI